MPAHIRSIEVNFYHNSLLRFDHWCIVVVIDCGQVIYLAKYSVNRFTWWGGKKFHMYCKFTKILNCDNSITGR